MADFFATAAKGTEGALRDELRELSLRGVRAARGGVHFTGDLESGFRACLGSRIALRVLLELGRFPAPSADALYEGVRAVDWTPWLTARHTLAVRAAGTTPALIHTQFTALRAKDAIVDQMRDRTGNRPSVDREDPDVGVSVHLDRQGQAAIYLDLAGQSLHRRGWRARIGEAPLKENVAAAILRLSGWDRTSPLFDPMCGSGTLVIEAALWSMGRAPGILRQRFGVERWAAWDDALKRRGREIRQAAAAGERSPAVVIAGADIDPTMLEAARANANNAGVRIALERQDVRHTSWSARGAMVVTNPPYGERLAGGAELHQPLGASLRRLGALGNSVSVLAGSPSIAQAMGSEPSKWWILFNGPIECRLLRYDVPR